MDCCATNRVVWFYEMEVRLLRYGSLDERLKPGGRGGRWGRQLIVHAALPGRAATYKVAVFTCKITRIKCDEVIFKLCL